MYIINQPTHFIEQNRNKITLNQIKSIDVLITI